MRQHQDHPAGPRDLADHLTELLGRLRLLSGPGEIPAHVPAAGPRVKVAARLLPAVLPRGAAGHEDLVRLAGVLGEFTGFLEEFPESYPAKLGAPLDRLARHLEKILALADAGAAEDELIGHHGWQAILASFRHAGSPLGVLDDLAEILKDWRDDWRDEDLPAAQEVALKDGWESLKKMGDRLFSAPVAPEGVGSVARDAPVDPPVVLLVDSNLRRSHLAANLNAAGMEVREASDAQAVAELLDAHGPFLAVVCDNLEPSNHLESLRTVLLAGDRADVPALILVPAPGDEDPDLAEKARSLGADGFWKEPFAPVELRRILQRLADP